MNISVTGRKIAALTATIGVGVLMFSPVLTLAASPASLTVDTINGVPPAGHCLAGTLTITGHGITGGQGGSWHVAIGWGDGATTTINGAPGITSGDLNGGGSHFTFSTSHTPVATSTGLTVMI